MTKLPATLITRLKGTSAEIDNNLLINQALGLETKMNFDIWKDGCFLIEAKLNINSSSNGLAKAKKELKIYVNKLKHEGMKVPKLRFILDYSKMNLHKENGDFYCRLKDFDFDVPEDYENYDITFDNGPNVAQQIYSRHEKINDGNIFKYFKIGIDWYNPCNLDQKDFRLVLDLFNDPKTQKRRGAFYTPDEYINISTSYLREAIKKVPKGKDYVILDRCAGSGQLEKLLTDDELSHCVLSTVGIAEWISLWNTYGNKVRCIIPPFVKGKQINQKTTADELFNQVDFKINEVKGANALDKAYYVNNEHLWKGKYVILLENPPYADATSNMFKKAEKGQNNQSYIKDLMRGNGAVANDLYSQFVWSAWNIVKCNEYIVYGPVKQWKINNLLNYKHNKGHLCNREKFHATESAISLNWFSNKFEKVDSLDYTCDLGEKIVRVERIKSKWNLFVDHNKKQKILAKMVAQGGNRNMMGAALMSPDSKATSHVKYIDIDIDNILLNLPLFVCNFYKDKDYTEKEVIMKSADGGNRFRKDKEFLNDCAQWSYLTNKNKCTKECKIWDEIPKLIRIDSKFKNDMQNILRYAKIEKWIGLQNIDNEYNTTSEDDYGRKQKDNIQLDIAIKELKENLNNFYEEKLTKKMFKYQLLK